MKSYLKPIFKRWTLISRHRSLDSVENRLAIIKARFGPDFNIDMNMMK